MYLLTRKEILNRLPETYRRQYPKNLELLDGRTSDSVYAKLLCLRESETGITAESVSKIISSDWASLKCDICGTDSEYVVSIETKAHDEYGNDLICKQCLEKALAIINGEVNG